MADKDKNKSKFSFRNLVRLGSRRQIDKAEAEVAEDSSTVNATAPPASTSAAASNVPPLVTTSNRFGLFQLIPSSTKEQVADDGFDIVAVHGLNGDYEKTWTDDQSGINWLEEFLPADLPGARVFSFGYDARSLLANLNVQRDGKVSNDVLGRTLSFLITLQALRNRPLIFVCHSMGGIVIKQCIITTRLDSEDHPYIRSSTKAIIFLSTPHRGSESTTWPSIFANILQCSVLSVSRSMGTIRSDILEMLKRNSETLHAITLNIRNQADGIKIVSCHEMNTTPPFGHLVSF